MTNITSNEPALESVLSIIGSMVLEYLDNSSSSHPFSSVIR